MLRALTAVAVLVSAPGHLNLWFDGFRTLSVIGPAFMLNAVGGAVIAALVVSWRHWLPLLLAAGFGASTLGAFLISATVGLFGVHEQWRGVPVWAAAVSEVVAIVAAVLAARAEGYLSRRQPEDDLAARSDLH